MSLNGAGISSQPFIAREEHSSGWRCPALLLVHCAVFLCVPGEFLVRESRACAQEAGESEEIAEEAPASLGWPREAIEIERELVGPDARDLAWSAAVTSGVRYSTNALVREDDKEDDLIYSVGSSVAGALRVSRWKLAGNWSGSLGDYQEHSELDILAQTLRAQATGEFETVSIALSESFSRDYSEATALQFGAPSEQVRTTTQAEVTWTLPASLWELVAEGEYDAVRLVDSAQRQSNNTTTKATLIGRRPVSQDLRLGGGIQIGKIGYRREVFPDADFYAILADAEMDLGPTTKGEARFGWEQRSLDSTATTGSRKRSTWVGSVQLLRELNPDTRAGFRLQRNVTFSILADLQREWSPQAFVVHEIGPYTTLETAFAYVQTEGADTRVRFTTGRLAVSHSLWENLRLLGDYNFSRTRSDEGSERLAAHGAGISLEYKF